MGLNFLKEENINALTYKKVDAGFFKGLRQYEGKYSVTSILQIVSNGEHLDKLFENFDSTEAMNIGTLVHEACENTYKTGKFHSAPQPYQKAWLSFYSKEGIKWKILKMEEKLIGNICGGTFDFLAEDDGKKYMGDYKTMKSMVSGTMLKKYQCQLGKYSTMYEEKYGEIIDGGKIVCFIANGKYKVLTYTREELIDFSNNFDEIYKHFDNERKKLNI